MPTSSASTQIRRRVGATPLRELLTLVAGPAAGAARWRGLLVRAVGGTTRVGSGHPAGLTAYARQAGSRGGTGYPLPRLVAVVACCTRTVIDAVFGPIAVGEPPRPRVC